MGDRLEITVRGRKVEGRFTHRSERLIEVEITAPWHGFRTALEMASFSRARSPHGLIGEEGRTSGEALLRQIFRLCSYLEKNHDRLLAAYREYETLAAELPYEGRLPDELFVAMKEQIEERLKSGEIDAKAYHRMLTEVRVLHSQYHERKYLLVVEFFRMNFSFPVPPDLMEQVLEYLRREVSSGRGSDLEIRE
jgi:hypothetical protein